MQDALGTHVKPSPQEVKKHLALCQRIRDKAHKTSVAAAKKMVEKQKKKNPPAIYNIGEKVLVRRFSSKSRKQAGKGPADRHSRIVEGEVIKRNLKTGRYKVKYNLEGQMFQSWFTVADLTSLTR